MNILLFVLALFSWNLSFVSGAPLEKRQFFDVLQPAPNARWIEGESAVIEWSAPTVPSFSHFAIDLYRDGVKVAGLVDNVSPALSKLDITVPYNSAVSFAVDYYLVVSAVSSTGDIVESAISDFFGLGGIRFNLDDVTELPSGAVLEIGLDVQAFATYPAFSVSLWSGEPGDEDSELVDVLQARAFVIQKTFLLRVPISLDDGVYHLVAEANFVDDYGIAQTVIGKSKSFTVAGEIELDDELLVTGPREGASISSLSALHVTFNPTKNIELWGVELYSVDPESRFYYGMTISEPTDDENNPFTWTVSPSIPSGTYYMYVWGWERNTGKKSVVAAVSPQFIVNQVQYTQEAIPLKK